MPPSTVDVLRTARLTLRPWTIAEAGAVVAGGRIDGWAEDFPDESAAEQAPLDAEEPLLTGPFGFRLVVERESGLVVGAIGLEGQGGQSELFIGIVPSRRGRGYATEAVRALVAHAFAASADDAVFAFVELTNAASLRVLEKAGFADNGFPPSADGCATIYEVRRPAGDAKRAAARSQAG